MPTYANINRVTGDVIKTKNFDFSEGDTRVFDKPTVWLEVTKESKPVFDEEVEKLVRVVIQPDISDLNVDVPPLTKRVMSWNKVALTAQELQDRVNAKVQGLDNGLFDIVEKLMVAIASNPAPLKKADFPQSVWDKINARLLLKGEQPV